MSVSINGNSSIYSLYEFERNLTLINDAVRYGINEVKVRKFGSSLFVNEWRNELFPAF